MWRDTGLGVPLTLGREEVLKRHYLRKELQGERNRHVQRGRENKCKALRWHSKLKYLRKRKREAWSRGGWRDGQEPGEATEGVKQQDISHLCT